MTIGFIGAGKMARALAAGLAQKENAPRMICCSRSPESGHAFTKLIANSKWIADPVELVRACDPILLAIKPQQFSEVLPALRQASAGKLFLSLATGVTLQKIEDWLDPTARVIRCMPNTPMQIGAGVSVYAPGRHASKQDLALVRSILTSAGQAWEVPEAQIDTITALSGSGPAYVFHFIEALVRGTVALGLEEKLARELALHTVAGSARLAAGSPLSPLELAAQVKSPNGTTMAGCAELEKDDALNQLIARCLAAAKARAEALTRGEA